jgi:hypothetical protein
MSADSLLREWAGLIEPEPDEETPHVGTHYAAHATQSLTLQCPRHKCGHRFRSYQHPPRELTGPVEEVLAQESFIRGTPCRRCWEGADYDPNPRRKKEREENRNGDE